MGSPASPLSQGGDLRPRDVKSLAQGHRARHARAKGQTQAPSAAQATTVASAVAAARRESSEAERTDVPEHLQVGRSAVGSREPTHTGNQPLVAPPARDELTWVLEASPGPAQLLEEVRPGLGIRRRPRGLLSSRRKLAQSSRLPLLPRFPRCSLHPAPARLRTPLGLARGQLLQVWGQTPAPRSGRPSLTTSPRHPSSLPADPSASPSAGGSEGHPSSPAHQQLTTSWALLCSSRAWAACCCRYRSSCCRRRRCWEKSCSCWAWCRAPRPGGYRAAQRGGAAARSISSAGDRADSEAVPATPLYTGGG